MVRVQLSTPTEKSIIFRLVNELFDVFAADINKFNESRTA